MGTSQSSKGSPSNVPMVPPWVPDVDEPDSNYLPAIDPNSVDQPTQNDPSSVTPIIGQPPISPTILPIAPQRRFKSTRQCIGKYASSGESSYMQKGLGHYVRKGYGGSNNATKRMGATTAAGGRLYGALNLLSGITNNDFTGNLDVQFLKSKSANEIFDAIINATSPVDGTQDAETTRDSMKRALSSLLSIDPNIDIMNLNEDQKKYVIQEFISNDITSRFLLDCEKTIKDKALSPSVALNRICEIKNFIRGKVIESFRRLYNSQRTLTNQRAKHIINAVIKNTFIIFEEYL